MNCFYNRIYDVIKLIPLGQVATIGEIAKACGNVKNGRKVRLAIKNIRKENKIPWYRVVDNKGHILQKLSFGRREQINLLTNEGVEVVGNKVDLKRYAFYFW